MSHPSGTSGKCFPDRIEQVRLLPPYACDANLCSLGSRFAPVVSVRALLNQAPPHTTAIYDERGIEYPRPASLVFPAPQPTCRGVGFILFSSIDDATKAILGLNALGFDASFAKVRSPVFERPETNSDSFYTLRTRSG